MSFGEELANIDVTKIGDIFDDLFAVPAQPGEAELDHFVFMQGEIQRSDSRFPVFQAIFDRYKKMVPRLPEDGMSEEQLKGIWTGIYVMQLVMSSYAESEVPDTFPLGTDEDAPV